MSIFPKTQLQSDMEYLKKYEEYREYDDRKRIEWELQMKQMKQMHEMNLAKQTTAMRPIPKAPPADPLAKEILIPRIMEMQKKLIDRLEAENARLVKELAKYEPAGGKAPTGESHENN